MRNFLSPTVYKLKITTVFLLFGFLLGLFDGATVHYANKALRSRYQPALEAEAEKSKEVYDNIYKKMKEIDAGLNTSGNITLVRIWSIILFVILLSYLSACVVSFISREGNKQTLRENEVPKL